MKIFVTGASGYIGGLVKRPRVFDTQWSGHANRLFHPNLPIKN